MTTDDTEATAKETITDKATVVVKAETVARPAAKKAVVMPETAEKKPEKEAKVKTVRGTFSMPKPEHQKIAGIKEVCLKAGLRVKKNEVLRAGLKVLGEMNEAQLKSVMSELKKAKTGSIRK